jgi:hypothetical protein
VKPARHVKRPGWIARFWTEPGRPGPVQAPGESSQAGGSVEWLTPWRFGSLLAFLIFVCFPHLLLGFDALAYGDAGLFAYPVAFYHRECFWRGEIPLWNPLNSCGVPFLAQWNTLVLYPGSLVYLLLPLPWSFSLFCLGHLWLAGMGMYFLAYRWVGNRLAASIAGAVFCFNGLTWYGLMWPHILAALAWMPWLVLSSERAWQAGKRAILAAASVTALQLLSGGAEVILQTWIVVGVLFAVRFARGDVPRFRLLGRLFAAGGLGLGMASAQLLPFLEFLAHSQRDTGYASGGMGAIAALPPTGWVNYIVPLFRCARDSNGVFLQIGQSWTGSYYVGIGVVLLALLAVWKHRSPPVWLLSGVSVLGVLMALGQNSVVHGLLKQVLPVLGFLRFPVKFLVLTNFALPLLAGFGAAALSRSAAAKSMAEWRAAKGLGWLLAGLMFLIICYAWVRPLGEGTLVATAENASVRALFLGLILGCFFLLRWRTGVKEQGILQAVLILLFWFDVFTHSPNLSPTVPSSAMKPDLVRRAFGWEDSLGTGGGRVMESKEALWTLLSTRTPSLEEDVSSRRLSQFMNLNLLDGISKFDGFYSLDVKEFLEVFKGLYFGTNEASGYRDFLAISRASNPTNIEVWVARDSPLPLITAGQRPEFADDTTTLSRLLAGDFAPRQFVFLPLEAREMVRATGLGTVELLSSNFTARQIRCEVKAEAAAMLVVSQTFYHPWRAYVDGRQVAVWRANYAFQALEVPPGVHRVELVYEDRAFHAGVIVSLSSLLAVFVLAFGWRADRGGGRTAPLSTPG